MSDSSAPLTVLVADDDPIIHALFRRLLQPLQVREIHCLDGIEAERESIEHKPDVIFLDVLMPEKGGHEVCKALRQHPATATTPILFLSSRTDDSDRIKGLKLGANDYLTKPMNMPEVSAKVHTYLELSRLQKRFIEMEKRRAVTGLLRGLAHQFNNILCGLSGSAQLLDLRLGQDSLLRKHCRNIVDYSQRAATISQQLLVLAGARSENGNATFSQIQDAILSAWDAALAGTMRTHTLDQQNLLPEKVTTPIPASDLQTCLFHLFQNGIRSMPEKGTVKIRLEFQENQIVIFVDDHGCGMSQSEMNAALEPFLQRWDRPTAAGLGLPFVRSLLEAEHGSLLLHSEVGCGTQVRMSFPGTLGS